MNTRVSGLYQIQETVLKGEKKNMIYAHDSWAMPSLKPSSWEVYFDILTCFFYKNFSQIYFLLLALIWCDNEIGYSYRIITASSRQLSSFPGNECVNIFSRRIK